MSMDARKIHVIGVGGAGTSGVAKMLLRSGRAVTGSDVRDSDVVDELRAMGMAVHVGHNAANVPTDTELVIHSAAVKDDNVELAVARSRGIKVMKYACALGELSQGLRTVAVSGTHGKTTTTAMITTVLVEAGLDPSYVLGSPINGLGSNAHAGDGDVFVVEACEYDRSFLNFAPSIALVNNIEEDHLDYYQDISEIVSAFAGFVDLVKKGGLIVANGHDRNVARVLRAARCEVETCTFGGDGTWQAHDVGLAEQGMGFRVVHAGRDLGWFVVNVPGRHNVLNALGAIAACVRLGLDPDDVRSALMLFTGTHRRFEMLGRARGVRVIDDYAHHPSEIQATLRAVRDMFGQARVWCVFQPHQHSRTRFLLKDFARSFALADRVIVPDIYFVRDSLEERQSVCAQDLVAEITTLGGQAEYAADFDTIVNSVCPRVSTGDVVVTMGAGNVFEVAHAVLARLTAEDRKRRQSR